MAETLRENIGSKSAISLQLGPVDPKFQVERVALYHSSSQKTRLNDLSCGIKIWTDLRFLTMHAFDRQTDRQEHRQTPFLSLVLAGIPCSAEKTC